MKNPTAALLLLTAAILCVGARPAFADGLEDLHANAGATFDNNGTNGTSADSDAPVVAPGSGSGSALTPSGPSGAAHSSGIPLPAFVGDTAATLKGNWKTLLEGAAVGGLIGVGIGSVIPGAGSLAGGLIGATFGMGMALLFAGDAKGSDMGKTLSGAGAGALIGMAFGSACPVIGTILGGIAGAIIGGALTHSLF